MVKVAFAGATTGLGPNIVEAALAKHQYSIVVLSRNPRPEWSTKGIDVRPVDYSDHDGLVRALNGVDIVISCVRGLDGQMGITQLSLIAAAKQAGVRRFAPSEFAGTSYDGIDLYVPKAEVWEATKASGMEYTSFACGLFMNTLGPGTPRNEVEALGGLRPMNFVINMKAGTADIPRDSTAKVTYTMTQDIGLFVAAALDLERWDEHSGMEGETLSYNEVVAIAEQVTRRKFLVKYNSIPEMEEMAKDPSQTFYNQARIGIAKGLLVVKPNLNQEFPAIKPVKVEEYIKKFWNGVELGEPAWEQDKIIA